MSFAEASGSSTIPPTFPDVWDPISPHNEEPSPTCLARVQREVFFHTHLPRGVFVEPEESDVTRLHALVVGPRDTPYENGFFHFLVKFPPNYPASPPRVRNMTTDAGRVYFHSHLDACGDVCLGTLGTCPEGPSWNPTQDSLKTVLEAIQSMLNVKKTCFKESGSERPGDCSGHDATIRHETIRVAVCDTVGACLAGSSACPPSLRLRILKAFSERYGWYEKVVGDHVHLDGTVMVDPFGDGNGVYQYRNLLGRLRRLNEQLLHGSGPIVEGKEDAAQV
ncbi:hypothetical protein HPB50_016062 [Hyalomma asiaticum]|uniref:Uncharacterized protein n=1 Tax=Hyalomma asiaticum TaxID=266040 RepID=A0ACB7SHZ9_HYAAI|nr:hypothetical protein HPB50_016062 [Hyalomma asiaticum]